MIDRDRVRGERCGNDHTRCETGPDQRQRREAEPKQIGEADRECDLSEVAPAERSRDHEAADLAGRTPGEAMVGRADREPVQLQRR
jgi:hypothetical protein